MNLGCRITIITHVEYYIFTPHTRPKGKKKTNYMVIVCSVASYLWLRIARESLEMSRVSVRLTRRRLPRFECFEMLGCESKQPVAVHWSQRTSKTNTLLNMAENDICFVQFGRRRNQNTCTKSNHKLGQTAKKTIW